MDNHANESLYLIYDGDCILCANSARVVKIKQNIGKLELINARTPHPMVQLAIKQGYDLNEGILIWYQGSYYYGADAMHFLALISSSSDFFNKLNHFLFRHQWL